MEATKRKRRLAAVAAVLAASGLALGLALWSYRERLASIDLQAWVDRLADYGPLPYYAAMSVLPSLWFPVSPFLLAGGAIFGLPTAIAGSAVALALNMSLSWFLAGYWLRPWFERLVGRFGYNVPHLSHGNMLQIALLLRLMPGTPFPFQNYLLGLARMPYGWYMLVSLPISLLIGTSFILFGDAIMKGDAGLVLLAVVLFLLLSILVRFARQRLKAKQIQEEVK